MLQGRINVTIDCSHLSQKFFFWINDIPLEWLKTFLSKNQHFRKIYFEISSQKSHLCVVCIRIRCLGSKAYYYVGDVYCSVEFIQFMWMVVFCTVFETNTWFGTFSEKPLNKIVRVKKFYVWWRENKLISKDKYISMYKSLNSVNRSWKLK